MRNKIITAIAFLLFLLGGNSTVLAKSVDSLPAPTTNLKQAPVQQQPPGQPVNPVTPKIVTPSIDGVEVLEVYNSKYSGDSSKRSTASIGDHIVVKVSRIKDLLNYSTCKDTSGKDLPGGTCKPRQIRLYINGRMISGIEPANGAPEMLRDGNGIYQFRLDRNEKNDKVWADVLGAPPLFKRGYFFTQPVNVSIGFDGEYPLGTGVFSERSSFNFIFKRIHETWFWCCFFGMLLLLAFLVYLVRRRGLLRVRQPNLASAGLLNLPPSKGRTVPPYSLARFQMMVWFLLVVFSFLFIWLVTDAYNILSGSVLALIGISATTALSGTVIDNSKTQELVNKVRALEGQQTQLTSSQLKERDGLYKQLEPTVSHGFIKDILQDAEGISFHRLQMLIWTIVFGMLFVYTAWKQLSMPDFDSALLALQGIASGTYLGFKFPEKHS